MGTLRSGQRGEWGVASLGQKILLVDDDVAIIRYLRHGFEQRGYRVSCASNGNDALALLENERFEGLVLDLHMTGVDGWSVINALKDAEQPPLTILLSGYVDVASTVAAVRAGVYDVVEKPVTIDDLDNRLRRGWELPSAVAEPQPPPVRSMSTDAADRILGEAPGIQRIRSQVRSVARFPDISVLVMGETGTGKELIAEAIHQLTTPAEPFSSFNCAAIPEALFESELFGHEPGSFTGATRARVGLLESAGKGSVFLDEVGELPTALQPKLLRALETRCFRRLGGTRDIELKARVISATNRDLENGDSGLRSDLYFRLAGFTIFTMPLRERCDDIELLTTHLLSAFAARYPTVPTRLSPESSALLREQPWLGNVRELKLVLEHTAVIARGQQVEVEDLQQAMGERMARPSVGRSGKFRVPHPGLAPGANLRDVERDMILHAFDTNRQNLSQTARALGIPRSTLRDKLRRYGNL